MRIMKSIYTVTKWNVSIVFVSSHLSLKDVNVKKQKLHYSNRNLSAMDYKTLDRVGEFLKNASPNQLMKLAEDMSENAPHLLGGMVDMTDKEKAVALIKIETNMIADAVDKSSFENSVSHVLGLIDGCFISGVISDDEHKQYRHEVMLKREEVEPVINSNKVVTVSLTKDQKEVIAKINAHRIYALNDMEENLLHGIIAQLSEAIEE